MRSTFWGDSIFTVSNAILPILKSACAFAKADDQGSTFLLFVPPGSVDELFKRMIMLGCANRPADLSPLLAHVVRYFSKGVSHFGTPRIFGLLEYVILLSLTPFVSVCVFGYHSLRLSDKL